MKPYTLNKSLSEFSFRKPAVYKIIVQGELDESWSGRLAGLQIKVERSKDKKPITVLIGQMNDQSALSGVLTALYDSHFPIISVNLLND